ncbi:MULTISPECIES: hypothetical protein [unclassified Microcoleus]|uniref:hypothetical protein n=1 Tax=unclassified Microcoleus TaxID=2642155 RepID=UPI002FD6B0AE
MSFSERLSSADLQNPALSRRELLGKSASITLAAATKLPPKPPAPKKYPSPEFNIGDLVACDWVNDRDEDEDEDEGEHITDFGEVLGMRYLPESESIFPAKSWVYYIWWTDSTSKVWNPYPCYDGEPTEASSLRLVQRA